MVHRFVIWGLDASSVVMGGGLNDTFSRGDIVGGVGVGVDVIVGTVGDDAACAGIGAASKLALVGVVLANELLFFVCLNLFMKDLRAGFCNLLTSGA